MPNYKITINGLEKLENSFRNSPRMVVQELTQAIKTSVNIIRPIMYKNAPVKTSKLRQNIYSRAIGLRGEVGPNLSVTPYAMYIELGTKPHIIRPTIKKALYWKGALHPVKRVQHPGTKANPFVERTSEEMKTPINHIFQNTIQRIINNLK